MVAVAVVSALKVDVIDRSMSQISSQAGLKQRYAINFRGSVHDRAIAVRDAAVLLIPRSLAGRWQRLSAWRSCMLTRRRR